MTIIKKKSLIVALVSSFVISLVLILTLIGYLAYIEIKGEESKRNYQMLLQKVNARIYGKYIEITNLTATIESIGALKGKPIIKGLLANKGQKAIFDPVIKVKFTDRDGAVIYSVIFHPQEPALGTVLVPQVSIPYISGHARAPINPSCSLPFKYILTNCPAEIIAALKEGKGYARSSGRWAGKLVSEVLAVNFPRLN